MRAKAPITTQNRPTCTGAVKRLRFGEIPPYLRATHAAAAVVTEVAIAVADGDCTTVVARRRVGLERRKQLAAGKLCGWLGQNGDRHTVHHCGAGGRAVAFRGLLRPTMPIADGAVRSVG